MQKKQTDIQGKTVTVILSVPGKKNEKENMSDKVIGTTASERKTKTVPSIIAPTNSIPEPAIIIKSGATDLRREEKALSKIITGNMEENILSCNMYAFANKTAKIVKVIKQNPDGSTTMYKKHSDNQILQWPEFKEKNEAGHKITLKGDKRKEFLGKIGCPEDL
jgi:hypothetical protein